MSIEDLVIRMLRDIVRRLGVFAYRWWRRLLVLWVVGMAVTSVYNAFNPWSEFNQGLIYDPDAEVLLIIVGEIETSFPTLPLHLHTIFHVLSITLFAIITFAILWNLWTLLSYFCKTLYRYLNSAYTVVYFPAALVVNTLYIAGSLVFWLAFIPLAALWFIAGVLWSGVLKEDLRLFLFGDEDVEEEVKSVCGMEEEYENMVGKEEGEGDAYGGDQWQHTDTDYESSDENDEEESKIPSQESQGVVEKEVERPTTPPNQIGVESEKVDSVMKGQLDGQSVSAARDEGASPKARSRYTREP